MQEELTYEQAMAQLETLTQQMERGEIGIDEMAKKLQEAQRLMQFCKERLYESEKNCKSLLQIDENV
ncbi:MAG: exodeoxyribonuclease VII small subunit [Bacteroidaceae bacterium]|nr:exodeoxyribonuclease VII small subunit [Bacteroidaceae bacterium]